MCNQYANLINGKGFNSIIYQPNSFTRTHDLPPIRLSALHERRKEEGRKIRKKKTFRPSRKKERNLRPPHLGGMKLQKALELHGVDEAAHRFPDAHPHARSPGRGVGGGRRRRHEGRRRLEEGRRGVGRRVERERRAAGVVHAHHLDHVGVLTHGAKDPLHQAA